MYSKSMPRPKAEVNVRAKDGKLLNKTIIWTIICNLSKPQLMSKHIWLPAFTLPDYRQFAENTYNNGKQ